VRPGGEEGENDARVRTAESRTRRRRRFQAEPPQSPSCSHRRRAVTRISERWVERWVSDAVRVGVSDAVWAKMGHNEKRAAENLRGK
jgi:hypothetical protein